jgi:hypothetical protein
MKYFIPLLQLRIRKIYLWLRYPKAGYYTRMVLEHGISMRYIDGWVEEAIEKGWYYNCEEMTIHEMREDACETEIGYWEE